MEKYEELKTLVSHLNIPVTFAALGASNAYQFQGELPGDREASLVCPGRDHPAGERGPAAVLPDQPAPPVDQSFTRTSTISPIYRV